MIDTISTPGAISSVTSQLTAPSTTRVTRPFRTLRALILIRIYQAKKRAPCNRFLPELATKVTAARQFVNLPKGRSARDAGTRSRESRSRVDGQVSTEVTDGRHRPICCLDSRSDSHLALGSEGCILYSESIKVASARPSSVTITGSSKRPFGRKVAARPWRRW